MSELAERQMFEPSPGPSRRPRIIDTKNRLNDRELFYRRESRAMRLQCSL